MKIRPLHDRVIVKRLEEDRTSPGGIVIPDTAAEKPVQGKIVAFEPDFGATVLAEKNGVANLDVAGAYFPVLEDLALTDGDNLSLNGFFGRCVGNDNAARRGAILLHALHDDTVMQRTDLHE